MNGTCFECKFMRNRTDLEPCEHCTNTFAMTGVHPSFTLKKPPTTNADRIRSMTDEELAEFIGDDPMHDICPNNCHEDLDRPCKVCALDWLREEATP